MIRIDIGRDFSLVTGGRRRGSGAHSAEAFRDDLLVPALRQGGQVIVSINGPSYSMAWLEEAFGTLQDLGFSGHDLSARPQGRVAQGNCTPATGSPEAVTRFRFPQNVACGFCFAAP